MDVNMIITKFTSALLRFLLLATVATAPLFVLLSNFDSFEQYLFPLHYFQNDVRNVSNNILIGHYPDYRLLSELDQRGVKIVISLLNEGLIYEEPLIHQEAGYTKQLGLKSFNFKMDSAQPATSSINIAAVEHIKKVIAANPNSKIYIHCYLGKHRTGYVEKQLRQFEGRTASNFSAASAS